MSSNRGVFRSGIAQTERKGLNRTILPESTSFWRPLKSTTFRNLLVANVVSDIGAFMQTVGAAWL